MMKIWLLLITFLVGVGLGLAAPSVAPKYLGAYFPKSMTKSHAGVQGIVVRRQLEGDRLLLTISASEGALLATFKKKITEISLLIDEGDAVTLDVRTYAPFVHDPPIIKVKKPSAISGQVLEPTLEESPLEASPSDPLPTPQLQESDSPSLDLQEPVLDPDPTQNGNSQS